MFHRLQQDKKSVLTLHLCYKLISEESSLLQSILKSSMLFIQNLESSHKTLYLRTL